MPSVTAKALPMTQGPAWGHARSPANKLRVYNLDAVASILDKSPDELRSLVQKPPSPQHGAQAHTPPTPPTDAELAGRSLARRTSFAAATPASGTPNNAPDRQMTLSARIQGGTSVHARLAAQMALKERKAQQEREEELERVQRQAEARDKRAEAKSKLMFEEVFAGLDYDSGVTGSIQEMLTLAEGTKAAKRSQLYDEWRAQVYDKLTDRIQDAVAARSVAEIEARLQHNYQDYLTTTNNKLAVFQDVIIEADYNPLQYREQNIKYRTSDIQDPVKRDIEKPLREAATMEGAQPKEHYPGKVTLQPTLWDKLESTPFGRNMDAQGNYVLKPSAPRLTALRASHIPMDHYNFPTGPEAINAEMPPGKAPVVPKPGESAARNGLFDIMQRTDENKTFQQLLKEGKAEGDEWLSYKGRRVCPGPEVRRGRKNLYDVVHHTCVEGLEKNPHFTGGDRWLEAKGKKSVPGPEQLRGRKNLFETVQQSSNPYVDGRTLDDMVLEQRGKRGMPHDSRTHMYKILQDQDIQVAAAPTEVPRYMISELMPVDGSLTTRTVPTLR